MTVHCIIENNMPQVLIKSMQTFFNRLIRTLKLDHLVYQELKEDPKSLGQSVSVILLSALAAAVGGAKPGGMAIIVSFAIALIGWSFWAWLNYFIGIRFLNEPATEADPKKYWQAIGFTSAPGLIRIFALFPEIAHLVFMVSLLWTLVTMIIGIKTALNYQSVFRSIAVCITGWVLQLLILGFSAALLIGG